MRPKGSVAVGAAGAPVGFALFYLIFPKIEPRSGPSMASVMLPGKAEKRIASSVFITLVPPRREVVTKEKTQRELQPDGAEVPGTPHPQSPPPQRPTLPNGGEGRPQGAASGVGRMMMVLRMLRRCFPKGCVCRQGGIGFFSGGAIPQIPAPIPGQIRLLEKGCVCSPSLGAYQCCLSTLAGTEFAFGACQQAPLQSCWGVIVTGRYWMFLPP